MNVLQTYCVVQTVYAVLLSGVWLVWLTVAELTSKPDLNLPRFLPFFRVFPLQPPHHPLSCSWDLISLLELL